MTDWGTIEHFTRAEFICKCGCGREAMDPDFMRKLDAARESVGVVFSITSGYRCPEYNDKVSGSGLDGPHTTGKAADISLSYTDARKALTTFCLRFGGVGIKQHGAPSGRFIHVDDLTSRVWTYQ